MRNRETFSCPRRYPLEGVQCHFCLVGKDECDAATHQATYEKRYCRGCEDNAWFDPDGVQDELCVRCYQQSLRRAD